MSKRVIWIILDSVGIGYLPDSEKYGDVGANTLVHINEKTGGLKIPNLISLGLGNIDGVQKLEKEENPYGIYGKSGEISNGKDTTTGHWEMIGIETIEPFPVFKEGFPVKVIDEFIKEAKIPGILCNMAASGTEVINEYGNEHRKTKKPIIYTSADSVFQIACDESIYSTDQLYSMCLIAREILNKENKVARVIARPFVFKDGKYVRTANRRDFSLEPDDDNLLSYLKADGHNVNGIGKIEDIFAKKGITKAVHTKDNLDGIKKTLEFMNDVDEGLIFTNLVEFDSKWGHRNDIIGYARGLEEFDAFLPEIIHNLKDDDILIINADHGCDPSFPGTDHTREYVPIIIYGKKLKNNINLGIRNSFSDIGQTIGDYFNVPKLKIGKSFLKEIKDE